MEDNENETTENMDGLNEESEYDDPLVRRKVRADYRMLHNDIEGIVFCRNVPCLINFS